MASLEALIRSFSPDQLQGVELLLRQVKAEQKDGKRTENEGKTSEKEDAARAAAIAHAQAVEAEQRATVEAAAMSMRPQAAVGVIRRPREPQYELAAGRCVLNLFCGRSELRHWQVSRVRG